MQQASARPTSGAGLAAARTPGRGRRSIQQGNYFADWKAPFRILIYPGADDTWLWVHLTLVLGGRAPLSAPMVEWIGASRLFGRSAPRRQLL